MKLTPELRQQAREGYPDQFAVQAALDDLETAARMVRRMARAIANDAYRDTHFACPGCDDFEPYCGNDACLARIVEHYEREAEHAT